MTRFGVTEDYEYSASHKRHKMLVWSGSFMSVFEAVALSLPKSDGYMLTVYGGDKVRISCPAPRNSDNWQQVDAAINEALNNFFAEKYAEPLPTSEQAS